ncbi:MAG: tail fiber domain-containing protein, partial [Pseudomonadota bacterium]|nr:tail fiber domain-containing protein [Pseudomonadota bacterium]
MFAIAYARHFHAERGGDASITNSNSNFGQTALEASGFRPESFDRDDTGYITHIIPPREITREDSTVSWLTIDTTKTIGVGVTDRLYLFGYNNEEIIPPHEIDSFKIGARKDDKLYLNVNIDGVSQAYSSPILMDVGEGNGDGPVSEKKFTIGRVGVANSITDNVISLTTNHNFLNGESVRVFSDDGRTPDGIEIGRKYFVITQTDTTKIKLANTVNDALSGKEIVESINTKGGVLTIQSIVNDKIPGEIGHPVQYDTTHNQWYILGSAGASNTIYSGFKTGDNAAKIAEINSPTYVLRKSETRALNDRIYRLRYVIPKDFTGANTAKKPEKNYVLQESKSVGVDPNFTNVISNRNPKVIAGITSTSSIVTVTTEIPHKLSVKDVVKIKNVKSSNNTDGIDNVGFNGKFTVLETPTAKTFTFASSILGGAFTDDRNDPPLLERSEYDTTYTVQEVETIQDYIAAEQDGIYYLTCLIGNLSPTVSEFSDLKFKQNLPNLYPTVDKDNPNNDPVQCVSAASNENLGKITLNNPLNSITKEAIINYIRDNRVGFAVTGATSDNSGNTTLITDIEHNLNAITGLSIDSPGTGYGNNTTKHNLSLIDQSGNNGNGATVKVVTGGSGQITSIEIVDGGSAYGIGQTLAIDGGTSGVAEITSINNCVGNAIQIVGVGSVDDR